MLLHILICKFNIQARNCKGIQRRCHQSKNLSSLKYCLIIILFGCVSENIISKVLNALKLFTFCFTGCLFHGKIILKREKNNDQYSYLI